MRLGSHMLRVLGAAASLWAAPAPTCAQTTPPMSFETTSSVVVRLDRTHTTTHTVRLRINQASALASAAHTSIGYIDSMETLTVTEAFTEKPDGRKLPVDASSILTRDAPGDPTQNKDQKSKTLVFPDVAVDDTLVYTTVRDAKLTSFDGHFTYSWVFNRTLPWTRARHTIEAPATIKLNVAFKTELGDTSLSYTRDDSGPAVKHEIVFQPPGGPVRDEPGAVAYTDRDPRFTLTTFADYPALGQAYWREAGPKSAVTPELAALAAEITRGAIDTRARVEAIDGWVKRNIRYVAVYLGRERWIPQAAATVVAAASGDCKDHAALVSALLKASGIASEHALVNLGTAYALSDLPPGSFNHVMVHVPELKLYIDTTATLSAFGVLGPQTYDKPTLLIADTGSRLSRTPPMRADDHTTTAKTTLTIAADGSLSGETTQTATGIFAASARAAYLRFQGQGVEAAAEQRLRTLETPGKGKFEASSPSELREPFAVKATFVLDDQMELPLSGNRRAPVGLPIHARPGAFLLSPRVADRKAPFVCFAGTQTEILELTFADTLSLPRVPPPRTIETAAFSYTAKAALDGRTFKINRTFVAKVPSQVCQPSVEAAISEPLKEVQVNLGSVLVFSGTGGQTKRK